MSKYIYTSEQAMNADYLRCLEASRLKYNVSADIQTLELHYTVVRVAQQMMKGAQNVPNL